MNADLESVVRHGFSDPAVFADRVLGQPLWPHQCDLARSTARYRVVVAGRQSGKSRTLAVEALFTAFTKPGSFTLLVSAGESASLRLLAECAALLRGSPLLRGSVVDDQKREISLSNGSVVRSVPASASQIRGWSVDLLVMDEAAFIDPALWAASEPAIIARPGSRVILASSPWGSTSHFFRTLWTLGMSAPDQRLKSWHWTTADNPNVSAEDLEHLRQTVDARTFAREYGAIWPDESGCYFSTAELDDAVADYRMVDPARARGAVACMGVDWGYSVDANAAVLLSVLDESGLEPDPDGKPRFYVPYLAERYGADYPTFIDELVNVARGYRLESLVAETNGPGWPAVQLLNERLADADLEYLPRVLPMATTSKSKERNYGRIKLLLQTNRLILPREPELLRQLHATTFEITEHGHTRISVPETQGHDDVADALAAAVAAVNPAAQVATADPLVHRHVLATRTKGGVLVPTRPRALPDGYPLTGGELAGRVKFRSHYRG